VRVVGYVREAADPSAGQPAFTQQEELRRFATERGMALVAICQDTRRPGQAVGRDGFLSLLGVIAAGGVDGVLVPSLDTFSADAIVQEIVLWDLRGRGVKVVSTTPTDLKLLDSDVAPEPSRMLIRDVLDRVEEHTDALLPRDFDPIVAHPDGDVYVRLVEADERLN